MRIVRRRKKTMMMKRSRTLTTKALIIRTRNRMVTLRMEMATIREKRKLLPSQLLVLSKNYFDLNCIK